MELVQLDGYTEDEKVSIAKHHLFPRQREKAGLHTEELEITDAAFHTLIDGYTREAGVRGLERQIGKVTRKAVRKIASGETTAVVVDDSDLKEYVGRRRFKNDDASRAPIPGLATGLAVTGAGGDVLTIEVTAMDGDPGMQVTGQLGDVMSESAQIALSFVRANADELGVPADAFEHRKFHLHVPSGAIPKDGPSAGITMTTALASLVTGRPVKANVGMTGEVTLQGRVLPIGGVKQKLLAAHRAGLTEVLIPIDNEPDLDDVPEQVREQLTVHPVRDVREVLQLALS
jgi:ATP-dependent Lon protease